MNEQLSGYKDEPPELFQPLPEEFGVRFYNIELAKFCGDVPFYNQRLPKSGRILELGCGSGRLLSALSRNSRKMYGGDISPYVLQAARNALPDGARLICMDMQSPPIRATFNAILIGYNTLNLLPDEQAVVSCLKGCRKILEPGGIILLQLYLPEEALFKAAKRTFQFQILDLPEGGQLIKEIRKTPNLPARTIGVNERFRVRLRRGNTIIKEDYEQTYVVLAWPLPMWQEVFIETQLHIDEIQFGYDVANHQHPSSIALLQLSAC